MKKNSAKCPRCGKEYDVSIDTVFKGVSCPHCNLKMSMDKTTKRRLKIIRYLFVFSITVIVMLSVRNAIEESMAFGLLVVISLLAVMYLFANVSDKLCGRILYHTFGYYFEQYVSIEENKRKK